ncbi:hypothetical protein E2542_SST16407 [Spatholobus suberectus]|nr:hypothetical protein E2542_SST16407 [Spatholobus suberectus]
MGCCVSSNKTSTSSLTKFHDPPKPLTSRDKPLESNKTIEEETVKEVLSETPKWNPTTFAKSKPHQNKFKEEKTEVEKKALSIYRAEDTSEVCSLSETVSTATSITDQREETRKRVDRSRAKLQKNRTFPGERRERTVHGARNNVGSVRLVQCRDQTDQKMGNGGTRRRRDPADNSFQRARSPATSAGAARSVMGRSPPMRKTNRSTARVRTGTKENGCRKMEKPATEGKWPLASESLENPLVSLECFIFI